MVKKLTAIWGINYDYRTDRTYKAPSCPDCDEDIVLCDDGEYRCICCEGIVDVIDEKMKEYLSKKAEIKIGWSDCIECGNKKCVETYYHRNPATMEWQTAHGKCLKCGCRFIV